MEQSQKTMEKLVALCKNRGFVFAGSEIYGGLANTWDYGPLGVEMKNNIKKAWWKKFVQESPYNVGLDAAILMNPQTWVASGHLGGFSDPLMDCRECKERFRADKLTSPQLTAEWENNLTQIAKGAADPGEFLSGIEAMARELVQTHAAALDGKKDLFREEKPSVGKCPRCGSPVHEGKKNYYCSNKECAFVMWKNDRFFEERKTAFSAKIAAALLKSGKANVKKLYSPKTGKTYDGTIVLADTGGKYVNYRIEVQKN